MSIKTYTTNIKTDKKFEVAFTPNKFTLSNFPDQNEITSLSIVSGADALTDRIKDNTHIFERVSASGGTGSGVAFNVTINTFTGAVSKVSIVLNGLNYTLNDVLTIDGRNIGEADDDSPIRDLVLKATDVDSNGEVKAVTITSGDSPETDRLTSLSPSIIRTGLLTLSNSPTVGSLATVDITMNRADGAITAVAINHAGGGYAINDLIQVANSQIAIPKSNLEIFALNQAIIEADENSPTFDSPENSPFDSPGPRRQPVLFPYNSPLPDSPYLTLQVNTVNTTQYNGTYKLDGFLNDKPKYTFESPNLPYNSPFVKVDIKFNESWRIEKENELICSNFLDIPVPPQDGWQFVIGTDLDKRQVNLIYNSPNSPGSSSPADDFSIITPNKNVIKLSTIEDSPFLRNELVVTKGSFKHANVNSPNTRANGKIIVDEVGELFIQGEVLEGFDTKIKKTILSMTPTSAVVEEVVEEETTLDIA